MLFESLKLGNNHIHPQTTVTPGTCSKRRVYTPRRPMYMFLRLLSVRQPEANLPHGRYAG
jgi:hypothetical protein